MSDGVKILRELADVLEKERDDYQRLRTSVCKVIGWCQKNIDDRTLVAPFCIQVRDALESAESEQIHD